MCKIYIIKPIGYCLGVERAVKYAIKLHDNFQDCNIYTPRDLIHNEYTILYLDSNKIKSCQFDKNFIESLSSKDIVLHTAHGTDYKLYKELEAKKIRQFESKCVFIKRIEKIINENQNKDIVYICDEKHVESKIFIKNYPNLIIYSINSKEIIGKKPNFKNKNNEILVINQSTLDKSTLDSSYDNLRDIFPEKQFKLQSTTCEVLKFKYKNFSDFLKIHPKVFTIIIGSKESKNANQLLNIYKEIAKSDNYLFVNSSKEIENICLDKKEYLLISSTSASKEQFDNIYQAIAEKLKLPVDIFPDQQ